MIVKPWIKRIFERPILYINLVFNDTVIKVALNSLEIRILYDGVAYLEIFVSLPWIVLNFYIKQHFTNYWRFTELNLRLMYHYTLYIITL